ncbi:MAG TPA: hypothetical protein VGS22_07515 [Thermoanaerobaculia bacterium]|jgi:hypothetical protein|nr:hypothetical protein [Thermoanaerobaculia bacterium]
MNRTTRTPLLASTLALSALLGLGALTVEAKELGPFNVKLRYAPQESVGTNSPTLEAGISDRPVRLEMTEGRTVPDLAVIGESTDDDDRVWPVRATNDPIAWAKEVLAKNAGDWGIRVDDGAPLTLAGKLTRFRVVESNKAVGSTYNAEAQFTFELRDRKGILLWEGNGAGDATRYGRDRSEDNVNEVFSDATQEAFAAALAETKLQEAWLGKSGPIGGASTATAMTATTSSARKAEDVLTPEAMLAELMTLKRKGFDTDLLVGFVNQKGLSRSLSSDDLVDWKGAGMPEAVIKAALEKGK